MAQNILIPNQMFRGILDLPNEEIGIFMKAIGKYIYEGLESELPIGLKYMFIAFKPYLEDDRNRYKNYITAQTNNGKLGGRPKKERKEEGNVIQNGQVEQKARKARDIDIDIDKDYLIDKDSILDIIGEEEISKIRNELNILMKMIGMGYKLEKKKEKIYEFIDWLKDMIKQFIPLRENGNINRQEAMKVVSGWVDYWKNPPKGKIYPTNFCSSLRTSFTLFSKNNG